MIGNPGIGSSCHYKRNITRDLILFPQSSSLFDSIKNTSERKLAPLDLFQHSCEWGIVFPKESSFAPRFKIFDTSHAR